MAFQWLKSAPRFSRFFCEGFGLAERFNVALGAGQIRCKLYETVLEIWMLATYRLNRFHVLKGSSTGVAKEDQTTIAHTIWTSFWKVFGDMAHSCGLDYSVVPAPEEAPRYLRCRCTSVVKSRLPSPTESRGDSAGLHRQVHFPNQTGSGSLTAQRSFPR